MKIADVAFPIPLPRSFHYRVPDEMAIVPGCRVRASFGPRKAIGTVVSVFNGESPRPLKSIESVLDAEPMIPRELLDCAVWISNRYAAPIGECIKAVFPAYVKPQSKDDGFSVAGKGGEVFAAKLSSPAPAFELTRGQTQAVDFLRGRVESHEFYAALLYGVPASGKTEVYLRLIRSAVEAGGQALFLLPEISLTRPFFDEFAASLGVPVALWHSKIPIAQKRRAWLGLRNGRVKVAVGARSASLLPFHDLRLIVVDEEQDESFKQEGKSPYYHVRDVVFRRAKTWKASVVLGSATPSLETWQMARRDEISLLEMPERIFSSARPKVIIAPSPLGRVFSDLLLEKVRERLAKREQSILLVNRRGFSTLLICAKCGWLARCPSCGVAEIRHEMSDASFEMRCHHCSRRGAAPLVCPQCASVALRSAGIGTQKAAAEIKKIFPGARTLRMDQDSLRDREEKIYEKFAAGDADILIGTKLVAKSFHFPNVTFVGVVDADSMLHMPDFRAAERAMQLLAQVSGRSGRAGKEGEVLLQSLKPEHEAIARTVEGNYAAFADVELASRKRLGYPPHSTLIRLIWSGKKEEDVAAASEKTVEAIRLKVSAAGHEIIGPAPAVIRMTNGKPRYHSLIKVSRPSEIDMVVCAARECPATSGVKMSVNVDPYDLF
ncbi:MAG: replication restart helicase PriA [Elusimicrobiota bacterium]